MRSIGDLLGQEISGVGFGRGDVEFRFDGAVLRSISNPYVMVGETIYRFPKAGSRDALCLVIGSVVERLDLVEGEHFEFETSNGCRIRIPLRVDGREQHKAMQFVGGPDQALQAW